MASTTTLDLDPNLDNRIRQLAVLDSDVLILGPTGSGKSAVARRLHELSQRTKRRFISQNCAAIPAELAEGILFGHERGVFTGADRPRKGILAEADEGTLFLDEIGELPLTIQAKLLTVLQDRAVQPLGSTSQSPARFRLIAATHRDLLDRCNQGLFREDLYHRINGLPLVLPELRESPAQAERIGLREARQIGLTDDKLDVLRQALKRLAEHPAAWPGNIRELISFVRRCQLGVEEAERWKREEWARWRRSPTPERLTPFAPALSPSLSDRERFAGLIQELAGGGPRPKSAFSRKGSMALASRLLDVYPTPLSTDAVQTLLDTVDRRTVEKNIAALVQHGLVQRTEEGIVALWPPARSTLLVHRQGEWVPLGPGEIPSLSHEARLRVEVTSRCAGLLGVGMVTHRPDGSSAPEPIARGLSLSASKPTRVEIELDRAGGIEQILVHVGPPRPRGGRLISTSQEESPMPDSTALEQGRRWALEEWKEGWLEEHLVFHSQRKQH